MATHRLSIFGALSPDETGRAFYEPLHIKGSNDIARHLVAIFNDPAGGQSHGFYGSFSVPKNFVGTTSGKIVWTSTATSGNCRWRFNYRAVGGDDTESLDQASWQETVSVTDTAPSAAHERMEASVSLTAGNFAVDDLVEFFIERNDDSGTDTMAAAAILHDLLFEFADA